MADHDAVTLQLNKSNCAMIDSRTAPYAALVMRLALGVMFIAQGLTKVFVFTPAGFFESVGFPGFLAYSAETVAA